MDQTNKDEKAKSFKLQTKGVRYQWLSWTIVLLWVLAVIFIESIGVYFLLATFPLTLLWIYLKFIRHKRKNNE